MPELFPQWLDDFGSRQNGVFGVSAAAVLLVRLDHTHYYSAGPVEVSIAAELFLLQCNQKRPLPAGGIRAYGQVHRFASDFGANQILLLLSKMQIFGSWPTFLVIAKLVAPPFAVESLHVRVWSRIPMILTGGTRPNRL